MPLLRCIGMEVEIYLERHGFYPAGGGTVRMIVNPWTDAKALLLVDRGAHKERRAIAKSSCLPDHIAERETSAFKHALHWNQQEVQAEAVESDGPGNVLVVRLAYERITTVVSVCGELRACTIIEGIFCTIYEGTVMTALAS